MVQILVNERWSVWSIPAKGNVRTHVRIELIAHHVGPIRAPFVGGVESLTFYLARWLADRGHDVTMHAPPGSLVPGVEMRPLELCAPIDELARADVSMPPDRFMDAHHAYQQLMLALAEDCDADVVHSHSLHYLPVAMRSLVPAPMALTLHCPPTPWLCSALTSAARLPWITAVSDATRSAWAPAVAVDQVITNGIDLDAWPVGPGGRDAVWAGRIVKEKAPHLAIDAARAAGLRLLLAGPIIDRAYWAAEVVPRLGPDVEYAGHLDHADLARLVGASAVLLMTPVWEEPFGLVAAEAMASGTPVAAFGRGGVGALISARAGCLAPRDDVAALAAAAQHACGLDRALVRREAEARLGIDAMGLAYEAFYEQIAAAADLLAA